MIKSKRCRHCGKHAAHRIGDEYECCECYVGAGNPPSDWHPMCMEIKAKMDSGLNLVKIRETLTLNEAVIVDSYRRGYSILMNIDIDFGVKVVADPDRRARFIVNEDPIGNGFAFGGGLLKVAAEFRLDDKPPNDGALREFMERTAVKWLEKVAPHRLARASEP